MEKDEKKNNKNNLGNWSSFSLCIRQATYLAYPKGGWRYFWTAVNREKISDHRGLFDLADKGKIRSNGWKLKVDTFRLKIRHTKMRALNHENNLYRAVVNPVT